MKTIDPHKAILMENWVLCEAVEPCLVRESGLVMPKDMDKDVVSEGVAKVINVGIGVVNPKTGKRIPPMLKAGEYILYRGFLRFAHQVGEMFGGDKATKYFLLKVDDILATVEGPGKLGYYGEYVLE